MLLRCHHFSTQLHRNKKSTLDEILCYASQVEMLPFYNAYKLVYLTKMTDLINCDAWAQATAFILVEALNVKNCWSTKAIFHFSSVFNELDMVSVSHGNSKKKAKLKFHSSAQFRLVGLHAMRKCRTTSLNETKKVKWEKLVIIVIVAVNDVEFYNFCFQNAFAHPSQMSFPKEFSSVEYKLCFFFLTIRQHTRPPAPTLWSHSNHSSRANEITTDWKLKQKQHWEQ